MGVALANAARASETPARSAKPSAPTAPGEWAEVWVDLTLPNLSSLPREQQAQREDLRQRIATQQDEVMAALHELGAVELARVQVARNALAVRLPMARLRAARSQPGVRAVTIVRHVDRPPPTGPTT